MYGKNYNLIRFQHDTANMKISWGNSTCDQRGKLSFYSDIKISLMSLKLIGLYPQISSVYVSKRSDFSFQIKDDGNFIGLNECDAEQ